ncbi:PREDICTED: calcineurin B homologous protein 1-like [Odobenus rosmarus divergens]|uniref:Calcineurin B homologous protein 1-like n=1 Tax=Odobenus rosmarus divergens TaxID=9708 RepID=A0A9B0HFN6_ODORO
MGSGASTLLQDEELEEIKETGLSHSQITRLYSWFTSLDKGENGTLSREDFQRIPELAINPLGDRIINAFFPEGEDQVNFRGFMRTLAHFRPIEDNEKSKDVNGPEPLNSRSNKLHSIIGFHFKSGKKSLTNKSPGCAGFACIKSRQRALLPVR